MTQCHFALSTGREQPIETNPCGKFKLRRPDCRREPDPGNTYHNCNLLSTPVKTPDVSASILREVMPSKILTPNPDFTEFRQMENEPRHTVSIHSSEPATNEDFAVLSPANYSEPMSVTFHPQIYTSHQSGSQPNFASVVDWYRPMTTVFEENQASYHKRLRYVPQRVAGTHNSSTCEQVTFTHTGDMEEASVVPIPYNLCHPPTTCFQVAKSWYPVHMEPVKTSPTRSLVAKSSCGAGRRPRSNSQTELAKRVVKTDTNVSNTTLFYASQPRGILKYRFFLKDFCGIDKVIADPTDRRIRAICDRFQCDLEVYSKVPKNGYMQFVIDISSPSLWALHSCTRALDSSLKWCLSPQLSRSSLNSLPPK
ncbi:uncharacterized protein DEA37_0003329 [Paragonimus westermani]|uniref:Uncharacterized protein n=1 Tax=Paragonimus westermani TaxID=34504 RepID=A0A5J4NSW4_9TREM|nr:uncharacterized protein DEA37_0003329 [Paragonimus westermani]